MALNSEYQVLARRYRPQTFDEVVGQDHVARTLKKAIQSGRLAHAWLFTGTRGTGKTSMARILAKALNCHAAQAPTASPCLKCDSCQAIARGDDIDVVEIDAASNTQVDKTRQVVLEDAQYRPARSRFKVYIIDEVHMLSKASFNALLKTLEEPPPHVKFILATTEPEKVLPTILSRCQRYDFRNIGTREIAAFLQRVCEQERVAADESALQIVARFAAGSIRDGLSLLERLLSAGEQRLSAEVVENLLGLPHAQAVFDLAGAIGEGRVRDALLAVNNLVAAGLAVDTLLASLAEHLRNLLIIRTCGADSPLVEPAAVPVEQLNAQAARFDPAVLCQDIAILEELRRQLRQTQSGRALLDAAIVRLSMAEQFASAAELLERLDGGGEKKKPAETLMPAYSRTAPAQTAPPPPAAPSRQPAPQASSPQEPSNIRPVRYDDLSELWRALLEAVQQHSHATHALLAAGRLAGIDDHQAVIRYENKDGHLPRMLSRNGKRELVCDALSRILGRAIGVKFEVDQPPDSPAPLPAADAPATAQPPPAAPAAPAEAPSPGTSAATALTPREKEQVDSDPLIQALMAELGAAIVKVSEDRSNV